MEDMAQHTEDGNVSDAELNMVDSLTRKLDSMDGQLTAVRESQTADGERLTALTQLTERQHIAIMSMMDLLTSMNQRLEEQGNTIPDLNRIDPRNVARSHSARMSFRANMKEAVRQSRHVGAHNPLAGSHGSAGPNVEKSLSDRSATDQTPALSSRHLVEPRKNASQLMTGSSSVLSAVSGQKKPRESSLLNSQKKSSFLGVSSMAEARAGAARAVDAGRQSVASSPADQSRASDNESNEGRGPRDEGNGFNFIQRPLGSILSGRPLGSIMSRASKRMSTSSEGVAVSSMQTMSLAPYEFEEGAKGGALPRSKTVLALSGEHENPSRFLLIPGSRSCFAIDVLNTCAVIATGVVVPVGLTYLDRGSMSVGMLGAVLSIIDVVWAMAVVANFRTAFLLNGKMETSVRIIAFRYARTWLAFDLLTVLPMMALSGESDLAQFFQAIKMLRMLRLPTCLLRMKLFSASPALYPVAIALVSVLMCNVLSCGWRAAQNLSELSTDQDLSWHALYVKDTYFVMTVMSTVGFGDIAPIGTAQQLYGILSMIIAPLIFGAVVSLLSHVVESVFNDKVTKELAQAGRFMQNRQVTPQLQSRVKHNLRSNAMQDLTSAPNLLAQLSPAVQRELLTELLCNTVLEFPLFKGASHILIGEIAQAHVWVHCLPGDVVMEEGQIMEEIVFIIRGKLIVMGQGAPVGLDGPNDDEVVMHAGAWIGELSLFETDQHCEFAAVASDETELAVLVAASYHQILERYPKVLARHKNIVAAMAAGKLDLASFGYQPPDPMNEKRSSWRILSFLGLHSTKRTSTAPRPSTVVPVVD